MESNKKSTDDKRNCQCPDTEPKDKGSITGKIVRSIIISSILPGADIFLGE